MMQRQRLRLVLLNNKANSSLKPRGKKARKIKSAGLSCSRWAAVWSLGRVTDAAATFVTAAHNTAHFVHRGKM